MTRLDMADDAAANVTRFTYPGSAMIGDYLRAAAGLGPALVVLATTSVGSVSAVIIGGFAAIFGVFAVRTALRHGTSLENSDVELRASGLRPARIPWGELDRMKLAYYSTRRDRKSGWMQLQLGAGRVRMTLDSRLEGFDQLVRHAAFAAAERDLELSEATASNLQALGIRVPDLRVAR